MNFVDFCESSPKEFLGLKVQLMLNLEMIVVVHVVVLHPVVVAEMLILQGIILILKRL